MKFKIDITGPEFSHPLAVDKIPTSGLNQLLQADTKERQALSERFGLLELSLLKADLTVKPKTVDQSFTVTGKLTADVVQSCVVTLEPVPSHIEQEFDVLFVDMALLDATSSSMQVDIDREDTEAIIDGSIDLGELVAQHLGIALDPYPRKPGVATVDVQYGEDKATVSPFAKLADLPKKPKG